MGTRKAQIEKQVATQSHDPIRTQLTAMPAPLITVIVSFFKGGYYMLKCLVTDQESDMKNEARIPDQ